MNYTDIINNLKNNIQAKNVAPADFGAFENIYGGTSELSKDALKNGYEILDKCLIVLSHCKYKESIDSVCNYKGYYTENSDNDERFKIYNEYFKKGNCDLIIVINLMKELLSKRVDLNSYLWRIPLTCLANDVELINKDFFNEFILPELTLFFKEL